MQLHKINVQNVYKKQIHSVCCIHPCYAVVFTILRIHISRHLDDQILLDFILNIFIIRKKAGLILMFTSKEDVLPYRFF